MSERPAVAPVRWIAPEVSGPVVTGRVPVDPAELAAIERQAWDKGHAEGLARGREAAELEKAGRLAAMDGRIARLDAILDTLSRPLAELDEAVERALADLACAVARHVVRRELRSDPGQVIAAIRAAVGLLPVAARDVRVLLHPEDAALVRERLGAAGTGRAWAVVEDPMVGRGGCRIVAENSAVDARVESRIGSAIAHVLGDERAVADGSGNAA